MMLPIRRLCSKFRKLDPSILGNFRFIRKNADKNVEDSSLSRLNNQINYKRKFCSPEKVEVLIPTIPYQAFDHCFMDSKIKPWNALDILYSVRRFAQNPAGHTDNPTGSIVDTHLLPTDSVLPAIVAIVNVDRSFHDERSPKFPLQAEMQVTHIGSSSSRSFYSVKHKDMLKPYMTCWCDDVIIGKASRRSIKYPVWWQTKYAYLKKSKRKFEIPANESKFFSTKSECHLEFEHIDENKHMSARTYIKFCTNLAYKAVTNGTHLGYFSCAYLRAGIKRMQLFYHSESIFGDTLIVKMFEDNSKVNELYFEIMKLGTTKDKNTKCATIVLEFYKPT